MQPYLISKSLEDSTIRVWDINGNEKFKIFNKDIYNIIPDHFLYEIEDDKYNKYDYSGNLLATYEFEDSILNFRFKN